MKSLRARLLVALIAALLAAGAVASAATYFSARAEVSALLDEELRQVALSVRQYALLDLTTLAPAPSPDGGHRVVVQVWDPAGRVLYLSDDSAPLPLSARTGFATVTHLDRQWRMFTTLAGARVVQTAQPTSVRTALAADAALRILVPIVAAIPLLAALVWFIVGKALEPLAKLAHALQSRTPVSLEPLPVAGLPTEVTPLVAALNGLLARLAQSFHAQRRFAGDAAHELRTPLTALALQIQLVERAAGDAERTTAIARLKDGVQRATRLVQQLLTLARIEPEAAERPLTPVALARVAESVVAEQQPIAAAKGISVAIEADATLRVRGNEDALAILAANLVDNAIRYNSAGGHVEVRVRRIAEDAVLEVADDGPGIPPEERERVFDRFYRGAQAQAPGSGLGLAIAQEVATLHGGRLSLLPGVGGKGVSVRFTVPLAGVVEPGTERTTESLRETDSDPPR
jgi:two-component system OmpR family sensor kinase